MARSTGHHFRAFKSATGLLRCGGRRFNRLMPRHMLIALLVTFVGCSPPTNEAPTGRSFHAEHEAVIPNDIFPITANYIQESYNGSVVIDGNNEGCICEIEIQALHDYGVITDTDGIERDYTGLNWSHIHIPFGAFWPSDRSLDRIAGNYRGNFRYRDQENNGWNITFSYEARQPTDIAGDLDLDESLDMNDLDTLVHNVALGSTHLRLDMNEDEVVNVDDVHFWVTQLNNSWVGDADLDGEFNSGDLVDVFTAGKYETNEMAIWSEGDWNADERFDSTDFVVAFQGGGYEMGIRRPAATVPEPSSWILAIMGLGAIARLRR